MKSRIIFLNTLEQNELNGGKKMLKLRRDSFIKDIIILLIISILCSALFATGFAMTTDKYFAKAITGVMGDFGQYDLLFQSKEELKGAMARQLKEIINEHFPGATLKPGISVAGTATFFLTLPDKYKNKTTYNTIGSYFNNLPGNGGYSIMTEPRIIVSSVPGGVFDLLSQEIEQISGVEFTYNSGGSIGVILKDLRSSETVNQKIKSTLKKYQILEIRLNNSYATQEIASLSKQVSQKILGLKGIDYVRDITLSSGSNDNQYLINTLSQVKRFLMAYAAEVKIQPKIGQKLEVGDLLVANGQNSNPIKTGGRLEPLEVVVKVIAKNETEIRGLIVQGDAAYLHDNLAYQVLPGDKIGNQVGTITVSDRKAQLVYGVDQGVKLLDKLNQGISDFNNATGGSGLTVSSIEKSYQQLAKVKSALDLIEANLSGINGKIEAGNLTRTVELINGIADDLDYLSRTFARIQVLENRFDQVLSGLQGVKFLSEPLLANVASEGFKAKLEYLDTQFGTIESALRTRVRAVDDFVNRFNPLVATLLSWRNKAREFGEQINNFGTTFTPGSANYQKLQGMIASTNQVLTILTGFNLDQVKQGLNTVGGHLFGSDQVDLGALIAELEKARDSLPKLLDEEIGHSIALIDKYAGGEVDSGQKIQIFTKAEADRFLVDATVKDLLNNDNVAVFSLPVGTIQPDIRGELFKILAEVRSTIAALVLAILWILTFMLDHSLVISMLRMMDFSFLPKHLKWKHPGVNTGYRLLRVIINPANFYAAVLGGIWLGVTFALANARLPYLNYWEIGLVGSILGVLISLFAEKFNPISKDEVMAGLSLGLPFKMLMREIVIPSGRPGLMQFLNRWKMIMK